jgi:hypothetical protein
LRLERLRQEGSLAAFGIVGNPDLAGMAGDVEHLQVRPPSRDPVGQLAAVEAGHHDVGNEHVDRPAVALREPQRLDAAERLQHAIPAFGQRFVKRF